MITKITLSNIASYDQPTSLTTDKRINLIFGLNGTGKSILSEYLRCKDNGGDKYNSCELKGHDGEKILVYNQGFVKENFYESEDQKQKGIFTVAKENTEAVKKIKTAEKEIKNLEGRLEEARELLKIINSEDDKKLKELENTIWDKIYRVYNDTSLKPLLSGLGTKTNLRQHLLKQSVPQHKSTTTTEKLKRDYSQIESSALLAHISGISNAASLSAIETNTIWTETILGDQNSLLAKLITERDNADWVREGRKYIIKNEETATPCPFCQEETIDNKLLEQLDNYFNQTFKEKLEEIKAIHHSYANLFSDIKSKLEDLENPYIADNLEKFHKLSGRVNNIIKKNLTIMSNKIRSPSQSTPLDQSTSYIDDFNSFIKSINAEIAQHNVRIKDSEQTKQNILSKFWEIMSWECKHELQSWNSYNQSSIQKSNNIKSNIASLKKELGKCHSIILDQNKNITNVQNSIDRINHRLKYMGIDNFKIIKYVDGLNDPYYKISRTGKDSKVFTSLSEGEKMLISFLYFLELCRGKESADEGNIKKIVVIDDPISSLSHNHVFNISDLICQHLIARENQDTILQLFVLTHNLYFLHELSRSSPKTRKHTKYLRIQRNHHGSTINCMDANDIASDYQHYWHIIKQCSPAGPQYLKVVMANVMRNIFEHYFNFIQNSTYQDTIRNLASKDRKYQSFIRYMDKESHSYPFDYSSIDYQVYLDAFKQVFIDTGQHDHYKKYMHPEKDMTGTE